MRVKIFSFDIWRLSQNFFAKIGELRELTKRV